MGWGLIFLGNLALDAGEPELARASFAESVELLRALADYGLLAYPLRRLAHIALADGDLAAARALSTESLRLNQAVDDRPAVVACLAAHMAIAAAAGETAGGTQRLRHFRHAATLCGLITARPRRSATRSGPPTQPCSMEGELERATVWGEEALTRFQAHDIRGGAERPGKAEQSVLDKEEPRSVVDSQIEQRAGPGY